MFKNKKLFKILTISVAIIVIVLPIIGYMLSFSNRGLVKRIGEDVLATIAINKTCEAGSSGSCVLYVNMNGNETVDRLMVPGFFTPPCRNLYGGTGLLVNNSLKILGLREFGETKGNESLSVRIPWSLLLRNPGSKFVVFLACLDNNVYRVLVIS